MSDWRSRARPVQAEATSAAPAGGGGWRSRARAVAAPMSDLEASAHAVGQGATGGFFDELGGAIAKLVLPEKTRMLGPAMQFSEDDSPEQRRIKEEAQAAESKRMSTSTYQDVRDSLREGDKRAQENDLYTPLKLASGVASAIAIPGGRTLLGAVGTGAALGGAVGLGESDADLLKGEFGKAALDTAIGAGIGAAGGAVGHGVSRLAQGAGKKIADFAARKIGAADDKLDELAQQKVMEVINKARAELGAESQKGSRLIENLVRMAQAGDLTAEQLQAISRLRASGKWHELVDSVANNNLADLPGQANVIGGKRLEFENLLSNKNQLFDEARAGVSSSWAQLKPRLVRYLPPFLGSLGYRAAGGLAGYALGGDGTDAAIGALAGGGLRPMAHALKRMFMHPAVQRDLFQGVAELAGKLATSNEMGRYGPMLARAANEGEQSFQALHLALLDTVPDYALQLGRALGLVDGAVPEDAVAAR